MPPDPRILEAPSFQNLRSATVQCTPTFCQSRESMATRDYPLTLIQNKMPASLHKTYTTVVVIINNLPSQCQRVGQQLYQHTLQESQGNVAFSHTCDKLHGLKYLQLSRQPSRQHSHEICTSSSFSSKASCSAVETV